MTALVWPTDLVPWQLPQPDDLVDSVAYQDAVARVYSYSERPRSAAALALGRVRKLERVRELLRQLGTPQARMHTVLVAGTKGKGSMAAMLASILHAAGEPVGRFTQPHLYSFRERCWVDGAFVTADEVVDLVRSMGPALDTLDASADDLGPLTTFDVGFALCLLHFARRDIHTAVLEVGVGGRTDATNVVDPVLSMIGPVGYDHLDVLGPTLRDVALHKAGIMRSGVPVLIGRQMDDVAAVLRERATEVGAAYVALGDAIRWTGGPCAPEFSVMLGANEGAAEVSDLRLPLAGRFQRDNAALAVAGARLLPNVLVSNEQVRAGLADLSWPGRFQVVQATPRTIVDGAHNEAAARALRECIEACDPGRKVTLVLGMSVSKDAAAFVRELQPVVERVVVTAARYKAAPIATLSTIAEQAGLPVELAPTPGAAVVRAQALAGPEGTVVVTGSLFLVGEVLEWLLTRAGAS